MKNKVNRILPILIGLPHVDYVCFNLSLIADGINLHALSPIRAHVLSNRKFTENCATLHFSSNVYIFVIYCYQALQQAQKELHNYHKCIRANFWSQLENIYFYYF